MIKLSVIIITYNEERNIKRCIDSVKDIADEIVVVDSFSIDDTKQICYDSGVKFFEKDFTGYSETKNYANSLASNEWLLSIDADEALSDKLKQSIKDISENTEFNSFTMNRMTNYCGKWIKHGTWYPDRKVRIFKKDSCKWIGDIHEGLNFNSDNNNGFLKGDILHYSYYSIAQHIEQINKFSDIAAKAKFEKGQKSNLFKIIFSPFLKFIKIYIFNAGFLDGYYGFVISINSSFSNYLKYIKLRRLVNEK